MKVQTAEFVLSAHRAEDFIRDHHRQVAFVGRSNVGKSSLLNRLLGVRGLAKTSSTPGRTRSVNYFLVNQRLYFVDLPGYGFAKAGRQERRRWAAVVEQYFDEAPEGLPVVLLVDAKVGATPLDEQAHVFLREAGVEVIVTATKVDQVGKTRRPKQLRQIAAKLGLSERDSVLQVSARTGEGVRNLWHQIAQS